MVSAPSLPGRWLRLDRVANAYPHPTRPWIAANLWTPQQLGTLRRFDLDDAPPRKLLPGPVPWEIVSWAGDLLLVAAPGKRNALGLVDAHGNGLHHELALPPDTLAVYAEHTPTAVIAWAFDARSRWTGHRFTVSGESLVRVETLSTDAITQPAWHPDSARYAFYQSHPDGARPEIQLVEGADRTVLSLPPLLGQRRHTHLSWIGPDTLLLSDYDLDDAASIRLLRVTASSGAVEALIEQRPFARLQMAPQRTRVAYATDDGALRVLTLGDGTITDAPWEEAGTQRECLWWDDDTLVTLSSLNDVSLVRVWNVVTHTTATYGFDRAVKGERFDPVRGCVGRLFLVSQRAPRRVFLCDDLRP